MRIFNRILLFGLAALLFAACSPGTTATAASIQIDNPYAPQAGDDALRGDVIRIDSSSLNVAESQPPQVTLDFAYFPPTPCHQLRVTANQPDAQNRINVKAYTVVEKDKPCNLMALATPLQASLSFSGFPKGHYSLWLNDSKVGEFDS